MKGITHSQKLERCNKSADKLKRTGSTSRYQLECVRTACDSLMATGLLQIVNRFIAMLER